jgi:hypothetical protein
LSPWLQVELRQRGLPAVCLEAWHVRAALSGMRNKTDKADAMGIAHTALAVWEYCEASAAYIFGDMLGDPVADEIKRALQQAGPQRPDQDRAPRPVRSPSVGGRISAALALLATRGSARMEMRKTAGRDAEVWVATEVR